MKKTAMPSRLVELGFFNAVGFRRCQGSSIRRQHQIGLWVSYGSDGFIDVRSVPPVRPSMGRLVDLLR